jgi:hypothetical protein
VKVESEEEAYREFRKDEMEEYIGGGGSSGGFLAFFLSI